MHEKGRNVGSVEFRKQKSRGNSDHQENETRVFPTFHNHPKSYNSRAIILEKSYNSRRNASRSRQTECK